MGRGPVYAGLGMAALNRANDILFRYIIDSLRNGGVAERPFMPATSKIFCYESRQILMDRAAETDRLLKKTIRRRKRDHFVAFAEKVAEKPTGELLKIMSNIRRGSLDGAAQVVSSQSPMVSRHMQTISVRYLLQIVLRERRLRHT